jgi:hypothetical protein
MIDSPIRSVTAAALPDGARYNLDNLAVMLNFVDGSIANLLYLANGDRAVPKEFFEVFCQGAVARLDDFRTLELARNGKVQKFRGLQDKGHRQELQSTIDAIRSGSPSPISFEELVDVTETTFLVRDALASAQVPWLPREAPVDSADRPLLDSPDACQQEYSAAGDAACA